MNMDITEIMRTWVELPGFPLVTLTLNNSQLFVKQQPFVHVGEKKSWYVSFQFML